jgi:acetyl-CoA C-acetyltransferase
MNPARVAALRLGMGEAMTAFTVQINCGSGMQSIDTAYRYIREGTMDLVLAGGAESLSHAPLVFNHNAVEWYARIFGARNIWARFIALLGVKPSFFKPVIGLERGLTDPITDLNMGQTAELVAHLFHISRQQADKYAAESQRRLATAQKEGWLAGEVEPLFARDGTVFDHDDGVRPDSTVDSLALAAFERPWGKVTAGNSSQITDGASWVILASEDALKKYKLQPKAVILDSEWSALDPSVMGLGPVFCSTEILKRHEYALSDIDLWELNEAFAAQVLGCLAAWEDEEFCRDALGLRALPAASRTTGSMSTVAPLELVTQSAPVATASCCISSMPCIGWASTGHRHGCTAAVRAGRADRGDLRTGMKDTHAPVRTFSAVAISNWDHSPGKGGVS